ncbi:hypothetical protein [Herpetosiphon giganteus]|uniref:hypothetical protein n=1 Tax=Herpetosiphon giganteus TaxID=2029754 RepID=UPI00195BFA29|nr:hypothetical protein [Herpetosiphon giganteus]MBM7845596.1 hypothetical protein [Herpetosiphon giganteus]
MDTLITHLPPAFTRYGDRLPWPSVAVTRRAMQLLIRIATSEWAAVAFDDVMRDLITHDRVVVRVIHTTPTVLRRWGCAFTRSAPPRHPVVLDQSPLAANEWIAPFVIPERHVLPRGCFRSTVPNMPNTTIVEWDMLDMDRWRATQGDDA